MINLVLFMNVIVLGLGNIILIVPIHFTGDYSNSVTIDISSIIITFSKRVEWVALSEF